MHEKEKIMHGNEKMDSFELIFVFWNESRHELQWCSQNTPKQTNYQLESLESTR